MLKVERLMQKDEQKRRRLEGKVERRRTNNLFRFLEKLHDVDSLDVAEAWSTSASLMTESDSS
jgi:hypothetical protein